MPCCAFAAFVASQILLGLATIKRFVLRSGDELDDSPSNPATEWRLTGGAVAPAVPSKRGFGLRRLTIAASMEFLLAIGSAAYAYHLHVQGQHRIELASVASTPLCRRIR